MTHVKVGAGCRRPSRRLASRARVAGMSARSFVPAIELSGAFYGEVVRPLLAGQARAAALLGWRSDVLGYDTARSTDHGWGPRLLVFVEGIDAVDRVQRRLDAALPEQFRGWPVPRLAGHPS